MHAHSSASGHKVLLVEEVAQILRLSPDAVRKRLSTGELPGVKIGGAWRVPAARLDAFLAAGEVATP